MFNWYDGAYADKLRKILKEEAYKWKCPDCGKFCKIFWIDRDGKSFAKKICKCGWEN